MSELVVFSAASGQPIPAPDWMRDLQDAAVVLMGEVHSNPRHHQLRAHLLAYWAGRSAAFCGPPGESLVNTESRPQIVFEYFDRGRGDLLRRQTEDVSARPTLDALLDSAGFNRRAWEWPVQRPLLEAARCADATWFAAGVPRPAASRGARSPASPQPHPSTAAAPDLAALEAIVAGGDWPPEAAAGLEQALVDGHCGHLPQTALPAMVRIQRLRDASLAEPALRSAGRRTLIIAGNGHVGRRYGVPRYLGAVVGKVISIGFVERPSWPLPVPDHPSFTPSATERSDYDWIVVTPAASGEDPCLAFSRPMLKQTPSR